MTDDRPVDVQVRTALALYDSPPKSPWTAHEGHLVSLVAHWHDCGALPHLRALLASHDARNAITTEARRLGFYAGFAYRCNGGTDHVRGAAIYLGELEPAAFQTERRTK